jgi:hypothetical protein
MRKACDTPPPPGTDEDWRKINIGSGTIRTIKKRLKEQLEHFELTAPATFVELPGDNFSLQL